MIIYTHLSYVRARARERTEEEKKNSNSFVYNNRKTGEKEGRLNGDFLFKQNVYEIVRPETENMVAENTQRRQQPLDFRHRQVVDRDRCFSLLLLL